MDTRLTIFAIIGLYKAIIISYRAIFDAGFGNRTYLQSILHSLLLICDIVISWLFFIVCFEYLYKIVLDGIGSIEIAYFIATCIAWLPLMIWDRWMMDRQGGR